MTKAELDRYLASKHFEGYWSRDFPVVGEAIPSFKPHLWRWEDVRDALHEAARCGEIEDAERLNLGLVNPTGRGRTLTMGVQIVPPGERARPHRHTIAAVRFIIEGNSKAWTVVEGEPMTAEPGDFILTPNWTWHEHVNDGAEPVIWIDALDAPLLRHLQLNFGENYPSQRAPLEAPKELSRHAASLARPVWLEEERSFPGATYRYTWSQILETLDALRNSGGEPCDGVVLRYANPWTGGPTLPTFSCAVQLLAPGLKTRAHRHTSVSFYHVVQGSGATQVGPQRLDWKARDFFMIPNWVWHAHENMGPEDAILFSLSDWPLLQPIGLYREEIDGEQGPRKRSDLFGRKSFRPPT